SLLPFSFLFSPPPTPPPTLFPYTTLFRSTINALAPNAFWGDVGVAAIWGGVLMMATAYYGYGGLSILSYIAVPMFFLLALAGIRSEEHTSELQSRFDLVCRLLLEIKNDI